MPRGRKPRIKQEEQILSTKPQDVVIDPKLDASVGNLQECDQCGRSFKGLRGLKRHQASCTGRPEPVHVKASPPTQLDKIIVPHKAKFVCSECNKKFKYLESYTSHLKLTHSKLASAVACDKCSARCPSKAALRTHLATHDTVKTECPHCGQTFSRPYHLVRHLDQKGCDGKVRQLYSCEVCQSTFTRKDNLMIHLRWHISKKGYDFKCRLCDMLFRTQQALVRHHNKGHQGNRFECDLCGNTVSSRVAFVKHLLIHGEKNFSCKKCEFRCKSAEILRRHELRHSARKPHQCLLCERSFIQAHELTAHTFRHTGHSSIVCARCGESFPSRATLKSHEQRVHEGKPGLTCPHEGCKANKRIFLNEISLRIHIKSHAADKPFKCPKCEKRFHIKAALSSHVLTHQWERARRCSLCPRARAYIRGDLLLRHLRVKHSEKFNESLRRVREVLGVDPDTVAKITKEESSALVSMLDALQEESFTNGPMQFDESDAPEGKAPADDKSLSLMSEFSPVMSEEELVKNMKQMMERLIDAETLECLGWPESGVDEVLERVLKQCNARVAESHKFTRAACLRENAKQLFLRVIEDDTITRMMNSRSIDYVIRHVVAASED